MRRFFCCSALLPLLLAGAVRAESKSFELTVAAGDRDRVDEPVAVLLAVPASLAKAENVVLEDAGGQKLTAQLTAPSLLAKVPADSAARELHFILPNLKSGMSAKFKAVVSGEPAAKTEGFSWHDTPGKTMDARYGNRLVLRYMYTTFDESTPEKRNETYKVYHHLYDPTGQTQVTGALAKLYPHHRGIYYGFNKVTYGEGKKADVWHCTKGSHQAHEKLLASEAGPVLARQRVEIAWYGDEKDVFAREERELTVYHVPGGQLVEFASRLHSTAGKVHLDGDPQHAGFQFRASPEVSEKTAKQTYYLRPDGAGKPGETRNWDAKKPDEHANLPWNAMSFVIGDQRYTAAYLDRPQNPKPARFSERDYGRFGSYFAHNVDEKTPLDVNYRLWLQTGEMKGDAVTALSNAFVKPATVTVR
jgi:hypothetical protein